MKVFDTIAPVYNLFFNYQAKRFRRTLNHIDIIPENSTVLDIGCGTGAFCFVLSERGIKTTGVDVAPKMIALAQKHNNYEAADFCLGDALKGLPFADKSFDVVMLSYVVHGMKKPERELIYKEAKRLARKMIIFSEYTEKRSIVTDILEFLEGGDYFHFIKTVRQELSACFGNLAIYPSGKKGAWYVISL